MERSLLFASLFLLAGVLPGCTGIHYTSSYPPPPEAFAQHDSGHPFFDLHWTLEEEAGRAAVRGIVAASRVDAIQDVTVEVVGLDQEGKVLSRALGTTYGGRMSNGQSRPFFIRLRPTGREARFDVRVWHFRWEQGNGANGSRG